MLSIFDFEDYRKYVKERFQEMSKRGHGQSIRLARHIGVHTTLVSQVLRGSKSFTLEQAAQVSEFLSLNEVEQEYFLLLVQLDRAGNENYAQIVRRQIERHKKDAQDLSKRLKSTRALSEEQRAVFYSNWSYSAIRQLSALEDYSSLEDFERALKLPRTQIQRAIEFLLQSELCIEKNGGIQIGAASTHVDSQSPWVSLHHSNWRQKAIAEINSKGLSQLNYTCPLTLSGEDAVKIREMITQFLERVDELIEPSPSEQAHCLNIDWFRID